MLRYNENIKKTDYLNLLISIVILKCIVLYISNDISAIIKTIVELLIIILEVLLNFPVLAIYLRIYNSAKKLEFIETILYILKILHNILWEFLNRIFLSMT